MATIRAILDALRAAPSDTNRQRAYRITEAIFGPRYLAFRCLRIRGLRYADGDASVDSELSLLWVAPAAYRIPAGVPIRCITPCQCTPTPQPWAFPC